MSKEADRAFENAQRMFRDLNANFPASELVDFNPDAMGLLKTLFMHLEAGVTGTLKTEFKISKPEDSAATLTRLDLTSDPRKAFGKDSGYIHQLNITEDESGIIGSASKKTKVKGITHIVNKVWKQGVDEMPHYEHLFSVDFLS